MTCTDWSWRSGASAFRCSGKPVRGGRCGVHMRYPDRHQPSPSVPVEPRRA